MDSITSSSIESCKINIKNFKNAFRILMLLVIFNFSMTLFAWQTVTINNSIISNVSLGAMLTTTLWSILFLLESLDDFKDEKTRIKILNNLQDLKLSSIEYKKYVNARDSYEQLKKKILEKYPDEKFI